MEKVTFECEVITPMFLAGADGKEPELRPPSIKGAMRFWWRAMNGHLVENKNGKCDYSKLLEKEAKIFGGSGKNQDGSEQGKSSFSIIIPQDKIIYSANKKSYKPLPHHTGDAGCPNIKTCGKMDRRTNEVKCKKRFSQDIIPLETTFEVNLLIKNNDLCNKIKNLFILTTILGGFGKRSRRGFGSVRIKKINGQVQNNFSLDNILSFLNGITENNNLYTLNNNIISFNNSQEANYPYIKEIQIGEYKENDNFELVLKRIGQETHNHNLNGKIHLGSANPRLASPIYVSIIINQQNQLVPIITTLNTVFENPSWSVNTTSQNKFKKEILYGKN